MDAFKKTCFECGYERKDGIVEKQKRNVMEKIAICGISAQCAKMKLSVMAIISFEGQCN